MLKIYLYLFVPDLPNANRVSRGYVASPAATYFDIL